MRATLSPRARWRPLAVSAGTLPEALAVTGAGRQSPTAAASATLDEINKIYEEGRCNDLSGPGAAGLVVHMHD